MLSGFCLRRGVRGNIKKKIVKSNRIKTQSTKAELKLPMANYSGLESKWPSKSI